MQRLTFIIGFLSLVGLQGCGSTGITVQNPFVVPDTVEVVYHPPLPSPSMSCKKDMFKAGWWENEEGEIRPLLGVTPDDSNLLRSCLEDSMVNKHLQWVKLACYYREVTDAPDHPLCEKHKVLDDEESN